MHSIIMQGRRCALAHMQEEYLTLHTAYMNDPEVNRFIRSRPPFSIEQQREWLWERARAGDRVYAVLALDHTGTGEQFTFVGVMDFHNTDWEHHTAHSASVIGDKRYWRKGIAREARLMQLKIGFDELHFHWIFSETVRANVRSQRLFESTGYELFTVLPQARSVEGTLQDELRYRVSRALWLPHWERYCGGAET